MRNYFYLDLDRPVGRLEVFQFDPDNLKDLMGVDGVSNPLELNDPGDFHVFADEDQAFDFLDEYKRTYAQLPKRAADPKAPSILLKRRYIVLAMMGLKDHTYRKYRKPWAAGQNFTFHDQSFHLTVRLKKLSEDADGYRYDFELI